MEACVEAPLDTDTRPEWDIDNWILGNNRWRCCLTLWHMACFPANTYYSTTIGI